MHELSLAQEIFRIATSQNLSSPPVAIGIRLGAWSCVHEDSLRNSFHFVTESTPLKSTRLEIERLDEIWFCETCQQAPPMPNNSPPASLCPWCNDPLSILESVQEMTVEWIEFAAEPDFPTPPKANNAGLEHSST
jgi:Zn finger protein HypA/HybF involved in hydrogenase expression